jgi:very-short-patch-repair endonuclease
MAKLASHADLCYNKLIKLFDHSGAGNTLRSEYNLFERSHYGYSIPFLSAWQALPYLPLGRRKETTMPPPKDPQRREEWLQKHAILQKGHKKSPEHLEKISASMKGKPGQKGRVVSAETRAKLSAAAKGKPGYWTGKKRPDVGPIISAKNKGKIPPNKGIPATPEEKERSSRINKERWANATEEEREKMLLPWINASKDKKNTTIEQFIATKLDLQNTQYEREKRIGNYWVDFYIASENRVIEVNGCYWHGCEQCGFDAPEHLEKKMLNDMKNYALKDTL